MNIRTVTVEFLRAGPRNNQLLSPLTPYLAVCGHSPAGIVHLPYEQAMFDRICSDLRYKVAAEDDPDRRLGVLDQTGRDLAQMLADVPGLSGALAGCQSSDLLHLRIVVSAAELAMLPFELAKLPVHPGVATDTWLLLQAGTPVCLTRHVRGIRPEAVRWPSRLRILFVTGEGDLPTDEHRQALVKALDPWFGSDREVTEALTVCENATIQDIIRETAAKEYTHVHILAHGARLDGRRREVYGVNLQGGVVSGTELAHALCAVTPAGVRRPTVVTLATCDSGAEGDVVHRDASVAHDLHEEGSIPLVVASQFPLTKDGSVPFVETFYSEQLWAIHPLLSLYRIRRELHARWNQCSHDWASLVVYEALPENLHDQLHDLRYAQVSEVLERAMRRVEDAGRQASPPSYQHYRQLLGDLDAAREKLPTGGPYGAECVGLRAASAKRLAEVEYRLAGNTPGIGSAGHAESCYQALVKAHADYIRGADALLGVGQLTVHRKATLHWLLGQAISMECVLGRPFREEARMAALFSAQIELAHEESGPAWGDGTVAELWLLRLADREVSAAAAKEAREKCLAHARQLLAKNNVGSDPVRSTMRQFERYVRWWGSPDFWRMLEPYSVPPKPHWLKPEGLVETAKAVLELAGPSALSAWPGPAAPPAVAPGPPGPQPPPSKPPGPPPAPRPGSDGSGQAAPVLEESRTLRRAAPIARGKRRAAAVADVAARFSIDMLPAENGDCLWLEYGETADPQRVIIDIGAPSAARELARRVESLPAGSRDFELFVLTHIDSDHISGVLPFFDDLPAGIGFGEIWFNGWRQLPKEKLGVRQGEEFSELICANGLAPVWNRSFGERNGAPAPVEVPVKGKLPNIQLGGGLVVTVLSPGCVQLQELARKWLEGLLELSPHKTAADFLAARKPEDVDPAKLDLQELADQKAPADTSVANGSSIALLLEYEGRCVLLTGDAHAQVVASSIRRLLAERGEKPDAKLRLDAMKLSHHGSRNALTKELLEVVECPRYLVSTNGSKFYHPDRDAIARVILYGRPAGRPPELYFNYRARWNELWDDPMLQERYGYRAIYPAPAQSGISVDLLVNE